jgi:hypothetical protein
MDKPIAWYDPTNGMVSTDKDSPLFTPLGQVLPLYTKQEDDGWTPERIAGMARLKAQQEAKDDGITLTTIRHPRGKPALGDLNPESLEQVEIDVPVPVQVSPFEFVEMVMEKEHLVGNPIFWAEWPNKEKNT